MDNNIKFAAAEQEFISREIHEEPDLESKAQLMAEYNDNVRALTGVDPHYE